VIVVGDDDAASDQNAIADFNAVRGGDMTPSAHSDILPDHNLRRESLFLSLP